MLPNRNRDPERGVMGELSRAHPECASLKHQEREACPGSVFSVPPPPPRQRAGGAGESWLPDWNTGMPGSVWERRKCAQTSTGRWRVLGPLNAGERLSARSALGLKPPREGGELEGLSSAAGKVIFFQALKHDMSKGSKRVMEIRDA